MAEAVDYLPQNHKALSSNPNTSPKKYKLKFTKSWYQIVAV
jgi:hypothetical protein